MLVKYTAQGSIVVECHTFEEPAGLRNTRAVAVEIVVADSGCGIPAAKLESIFREFEQVESSRPSSAKPGLGMFQTTNSSSMISVLMASTGLGLAVVARIVEQLGGQLRVDSKPDEGSRFSFLIPFSLYDPDASESSVSPRSSQHSSMRSGRSSSSPLDGSDSSEIDNLVEALGTPIIGAKDVPNRPRTKRTKSKSNKQDGFFPVEGSLHPIRGLKLDAFTVDKPPRQQQMLTGGSAPKRLSPGGGPPVRRQATVPASDKLRVLLVEVWIFETSPLMPRR